MLRKRAQARFFMREVREQGVSTSCVRQGLF